MCHFKNLFISIRENLFNINLFLFFCIFLFLSNFCYSQYKYDFRVNDDAALKYQNAAKLDVDTAGNFVVVWQDQRNMSGPFHPSYDIYCQRFNYKGEPQGNNFKINLHDSSAYVPNIIMRKDGSFIVAWQEGVYVGQYVDSIKYVMRIYNKYGIPISNLKTINDSIFTCPIHEPPAIGISNQNKIYAIMTMIQGQYGENHIYLQILDSLGNKIGVNEMVNDNIPFKIQDYPDISMRKDGSFIIVWQDSRYGSGDIFMQKYNSGGQKIENNIKVNDDPIDPNIVHGEPSISSDTTGNFCIVWDDSRESSGSYINIYCQKYDTAFNLIGSNFRVNQGSIWERGNATIKKRNDGYFIVGWSDYWANGQGWCPYFQRFSNLYNFIGTQHWITTYNPSQAKYLEDMTLWGDRIISVWRDWRNGNGDIFCNIRSFQYPDSIISNLTQINNIIPEDFKVFQNFPNPFNSNSKIKIQISKSEVSIQNSEVRIVIYNVIGKEITTLLNQKLLPGIYEINFDGNNLSTGLYFCSLIVDGIRIDTKKLILLK